MQATVVDFDPQTRAGSLLRDDGTRLGFGPAAFDASGLRLLRLGQRVQVDHGSDGTVTRITLPTMRGGGHDPEPDGQEFIAGSP